MTEDSFLNSTDCLTAEIVELSDIGLNHNTDTDKSDTDLAVIESDFGITEVSIPTCSLEILNQFEVEVLKKKI